MMDLGKSYDDMPNPPAVSEKRKKQKHYPSFYVSGQQMPDVPTDGGEFFFLAKGRVAGMRNPANGEKSMDIEVLGMHPVPHNKAMKMTGADKEEKSKGFRETMEEMMESEDDS